MVGLQIPGIAVNLTLDSWELGPLKLGVFKITLKVTALKGFPNSTSGTLNKKEPLEGTQQGVRRSTGKRSEPRASFRIHFLAASAWGGPDGTWGKARRFANPNREPSGHYSVGPNRELESKD